MLSAVAVFCDSFTIAIDGYLHICQLHVVYLQPFCWTSMLLDFLLPISVLLSCQYCNELKRHFGNWMNSMTCVFLYFLFFFT